MTKTQLVTKLAGIVVNNWIVTGDQPESKREKYERTMRRLYNKLSRACVEGMLAQITTLQPVLTQYQRDQREASPWLYPNAN